jgi:hypothetical protein
MKPALIAALLAACALLRWPPRTLPGEAFDPTREGARAAALLAQLHDPADWDLQLPFDSANQTLVNALRWRLLIPAVGHFLRLTDRQYLALPWLGSVWLLALVVVYGWRLSPDPFKFAALVALFVSSSGWLDTGFSIGCMDPFYLAGLLVVAFTPSPIAFLAACLLCPWIDERFLFALPVCLALRLVAPAGWRSLWPLLGTVPYLFARLWALALGDTSVAAQIAMQSDTFWRFAAFLPVGWWHGWRAGWPLILLSASLLWRSNFRSRVLLAASAPALLAVAFLAWDSSRSIAILLPLLFHGTANCPAPRWLPLTLAAVNFALPAAFVTAVIGHPGIVPGVIPF